MTEERNTVGIGIIGAGFISSIYLKNCTNRYSNLRVVGVADVLMDPAQAQADAFGVAAMTVDELLQHPDIEIVVNLTIPAAHGSVALSAVEAGKSVYNEKPLAATREEAAQLVARAKERGVLVGSAPDTFLGAGMQTARKLIDQGAIGRPVAGTAMLMLSGHERWHPNPDFYYQPGGGPLFDMGPYYLAALMSLLGPVNRVAASAAATFDTRTIQSGPRAGEKIPVDTMTHIAAILDFASGPIVNMTTTFDVQETNRTTLVLYGSEGTLRLPDPNTFGGPLELLRAGTDAWEPIDLIEGYTDDSRGLGVSDLARALRTGQPPRASGDLGFHIVDVMHAALESHGSGHHIDVTSTFEKPAPLALVDGQVH
jgi:predicted dehydrogenase